MSTAASSSKLRVEPMTGAAVERYLPDLARLRISVFREFPYLYLGNMDYETGYLRKYLSAPDSVIVVALDGERVVGASTAVPLARETPEVQRPFLEQGYAPEQVFYLGESVLEPAYRGRGIGVRFFEAREAHARRVGEFHWSAFCGVQRPADHPRRPADYVPLDDFWTHRGYVRHPELTTTFSWRDVDEARQTPKPMMFWLKRLNPGSP